MQKAVLLVAVVALMGAGVVRGEETRKGVIGDSMCAMKHSADKHGEDPAKHQACVERCVARGGEYVFLTGDKALKIANQSFADLKAHAGHEVLLTGEVKDETITVTGIEMPKAEEKK